MSYKQLSKLVDSLTTFVRNNPRVFATPQRLIDAKLVKTYKDGKILQWILRSKKERNREERIKSVVFTIILFRYSDDTIFENIYGDKCPLYQILNIFCKQNKNDIKIRNKRYALRKFLYEKI